MIYSGIFSKVDKILTAQSPQASYMKANTPWDETVIILIKAEQGIPSPYNGLANFLINQLDTVLTSLTSGEKNSLMQPGDRTTRLILFIRLYMCSVFYVPGLRHHRIHYQVIIMCTMLIILALVHPVGWLLLRQKRIKIR